ARTGSLPTLRKRQRPALLSILGLVFVALIFLWLGINLVKSPQDFFNVALIGFTTGAVYALVALGYTLVYGILQLINFVHGNAFALSGLVASTFIASLFNLDTTSSVLAIAGGLVVTFVAAAAFGAVVNSSIE